MGDGMGTALAKFLEGLSGEIGKSLVQYALPAAVAGIGAGSGITWLKTLGKQPLAGKDFKITKESTVLTLSPIEDASDSLYVRVVRNYEMRLKGDRKKGVYTLSVDLKGNNVSGKWEPGCQFLKNNTAVNGLAYEDDDTVIRADPCQVQLIDTLKLTLISREKITRKRGFYALTINSPKEKTRFCWKLNGFAGSDFKARAFASSEDFDLIMLPHDTEKAIGESAHPVSYFVTWSRELVA